MYIVDYLPRLGTLSINMDVADGSAKISRVSLIGPNELVVVLGSTRYKIDLPISITDNNTKITQLISKDGSLSIKMNVGSEINESFMNHLIDSDLQKWSVKDLLSKTSINPESQKNEFRFLCHGCNASIIDSTQANFRDMPSELWYEMMDFWHCHKPHNPSFIHDKNYQHLEPQAGEVYIGTSYLMTTLDPKCVCGEILGKNNKIFKWNLKLSYNDTIETYPLYLYVYYNLLDKINSTAGRNFKVVNKSDDKSLNIWTVGVGLKVSISGIKLENCLKILYDDTYDSNDFEEIVLEDDIFLQFLQRLDYINDKLPDRSKVIEIKSINRKISYLG